MPAGMLYFALQQQWYLLIRVGQPISLCSGEETQRMGLQVGSPGLLPDASSNTLYELLG